MTTNTQNTTSRTDEGHGHRAGYRPDIDGLRAIAVISVVLYHVGISGFSGGFVGVDVFFVLSGYLITTQLWAARDKPIFALLSDFYSRRARRILPSLGVVVICTLIAGKYLLLPNGEQQELALSGIASSLFLANMYFWHQSGGYFAGPAELQPLLHTWSLAVEEQFYLFWPLFLPILWFLSRRQLRFRSNKFTIYGIALVSMLSLGISILWTARSPGAAFFMMPSRLWELGVGAALALALIEPRNPKSSRSSIILGLIGLGGIILAVLLFSRTTAFPGIAALLPVLGTALVIASGSYQSQGFVYRFLVLRPMTLTGKISYSWYLWHWPLLAIGRVLDLGTHNLSRDLFLVCLAYLLAYLSTRYIENPIRKMRIVLFCSNPWSLVTGAGILVSIASISVLTLNAANGYYRAELAPASLPCMQPHGITRIIFPLAVVQDSSSGGSCSLAKGEGLPMFLVGDSHANHWSPAIAALARERNANAIERSFGACPVLLAHQNSMKNAKGLTDECRNFSEKTMAEVTKGEPGEQSKIVMISLYWIYWETYWPNAIPSRLQGGGVLADSLTEALRELDAAGVKVLLIGPTPRFDHAVPACVARRGAEACRISRSQYDSNADAARKLLIEIAGKFQKVRILDLAGQFCNSDHCDPEEDGVLIFRDDHHLSRRGAESKLPAFRSEVNLLLGPIAGSN